ncbi:MAG: hypothetical protein IT372_34310, partial [Polyangiaceae bacterium]|nr:hypothetical protein [Polyangiaceae bacterium]
PSLPCDFTAPVVASSVQAHPTADGGSVIRMRPLSGHTMGAWQDAASEQSGARIQGHAEIRDPSGHLLATVALEPGAAAAAPASPSGDGGAVQPAEGCDALYECLDTCDTEDCYWGCVEVAPAPVSDAFVAVMKCMDASGCAPDDSECIAEACSGPIGKLQTLCAPPEDGGERGGPEGQAPQIEVTSADGGLDIVLRGVEPGSTVVIILTTPREHILVVPVPEPPGGEDPRDEPAPINPGEELEEGVCPQQGAGCEILIVDLVAHDPHDVPAVRFVSTFERAGCHVEYLAPRFDIRRGGFRVKDFYNDTREITATEATRVALTKRNAEAWKLVDDGIERWRASVAQGKEYAQVLVNSHGSEALPIAPCGSWGPAFNTGRVLDRASFHADNSGALNRRVCTSVLEDWSCYGGLSPRAIDELNNLGTATCAAASAVDHDRHDAHDFDVAFSTALPDQPCSIWDVAQRMDQLHPALQGDGHMTPAKLAEEYQDQGFESPDNPLIRSSYGDYGYGGECDSNEHPHKP